jgi:hypothetical protein
MTNDYAALLKQSLYTLAVVVTGLTNVQNLNRILANTPAAFVGALVADANTQLGLDPESINTAQTLSALSHSNNDVAYAAQIGSRPWLDQVARRSVRDQFAASARFPAAPAAAERPGAPKPQIAQVAKPNGPAG